MKKIDKITKYLFFVFISFIIFSESVFAYGYNVTVTSNTVTVGNSITLKISCEGLGGRFNVTSSNSNVASLSNSSLWVENNTQSITISTKQVGNATITIIPSNVSTSDADAKDVTLDNKVIAITVKDKPKPSTNNGGSGNSGSSNNSSSNVSKVKSSNNYLSSLTIDNFELNEEFDKESLEYTLTVPTDTEKIKINAQLDDSSAKVAGLGDVKLSVGLNTFEIVVTAENGSKKTYILKVTVLEEEPIKVKVDNQEYTIIRKRKDLPSISEYFEDKDIVINNKKVEGYYNDTLNYTVVGLKDSKGVIEYYIYKNNKYEKYLEYSFNGTVIQILDKELLGGYKKTNFIYDSDKIPSYQEVKLDIIKNTYALDNNDISGNQFYLFYGKNVESGKEYLYQYDALEKTVQRYNTLILDMHKDASNKYYIYLIGSIILLIFIVILFSIILICNNRKNKKKNIKLEKDVTSKKIKEYEIDEIHEIKDISLSNNDDIPIKKDVKVSKKRKNGNK